MLESLQRTSLAGNRRCSQNYYLDDTESPELRQKNEDGEFSFDTPVLKSLTYNIQEDVKKIIGVLSSTPPGLFTLGD